MRRYTNCLRRIRAFLTVMLAAAYLCSCSFPVGPGGNSGGQSSQTPASSPDAVSSTAPGSADAPAQIDSLQVHFIDVGQGDCTLIICGEEAMLIDAGDNSKGTAVQRYLQNLGIRRLTYAVGTHPDADHIGGLDVILSKFDCETVLLPDVKSDKANWRDVKDVIRYRRLKSICPSVGDEYTLGDASFTILSPGKTYETENDNSIAILLTHGDRRFLFPGDMQSEAESDVTGMLSHVDVLKAAHHGSNGSTSKEFLQKVSPTYTVISCGRDNDYGHPGESLLRRLKKAGTSVFRTDEQGTVIAVSDGNEIRFDHEPSVTWKAGKSKIYGASFHESSQAGL